MKNDTTLSISHDPSTHQGSLAENLRERGFPIAGLPEAPRDEPDEPDEPDGLQQGELPAGPTHVAARRSKDQLASARKFIAAAGRVKFDQGRATLKAVWMTVAYYASLAAGPERVCFAQVKTLANKSLVSERTIRRHLATLAFFGLIQTDHRTGGHAPTHWSISAFSPSVLGGQNGRAARPEWPGSPAKMAAEVSNRSLAPTGPELLLASKQPDGACAPPSARKESPQETKREQPTRTAELTQPLAPVETDTGGVPRGGATDKQIKFLGLLADRVGAEPAEELWRAADPKRLQKQIKAAIPFKDLKPKHTHGVDVEVMFLAGIANKIGYKEGVQRCECGAVRAANINRAGEVNEFFPWTLSGYLVDYLVEWTELDGPMTEQELAGSWTRAGGYKVDDHPKGGECMELLTGRWAAPMTFSDVRGLCETAPKMSQEKVDETPTWGSDPPSVGDCQVDVPADWNRVAAEGLVAAEAKEKARVAAEAKKAEKHALVMAEFKEKARVAAEAKEKAWVEAEAEDKDWEVAEEKARVADEEWMVETAESVARRARGGSNMVVKRRMTEEQWRARKAEASESENP